MLATVVLSELQEPPEVVFVSVMVLPTHTLAGPEIALTDGALLTVMDLVAEAEQPPLVTV
jgi:hypothetical protein